jgi:4-amino-4-deoxy-L-arabinose transferase-like glycosyltransferase
MALKSNHLAHTWQAFTQTRIFPYVSLLAWILPLLVFNSQQTSLMAHDEGLYANRARLMFESGDWMHPWADPHHKTPGPYWLIASFYTVLGVNEFSVRLPSLILGLGSLLCLYEIGKIILNPKVAGLATAIFSVEFLWLQYCRLGTPDVPMIFLLLVAIWALLKAELHPEHRYLYGLMAGFSFGIGFLVRSFVIFMFEIALLPYLLKEHRRHQHLRNSMLYVGFCIGLMPTLIWLGLTSAHYGQNSTLSLLNFLLGLGAENRHGNGLFFYVWNVALTGFPWFFLGLCGIGVLLRHPLPQYQFLIVGLPVTLFIELSLFSTRLPHYSLSLFPFMALLAAIALDWLVAGWDDSGPDGFKHNVARRLSRNLSYVWGGLGLLLVVSSVVVLIVSPSLVVANQDYRVYAYLTLALGLGWLMLPVAWIRRFRWGQRAVTARYWLAGWLIPAWGALAVAGNLGVISNYNPEFKTFVEQSAIAQILQNHAVNLIDVGRKTGVLINFYTPHPGSRFSSVPMLPSGSYTWIKTQQINQLTQRYHGLGGVKEYQLIQIDPEP